MARMIKKKTQDELDAILNSALDELEDEEDLLAAGTEKRKGKGADTYNIKAMEDLEEANLAKNMEQMLKDFNDPEMMASLEKAFSHMGANVEGAEMLKQMHATKVEDRKDDEAVAGESSTEKATAKGGGGGAVAESGKSSETESAQFPNLDQQTDIDRTVAKTLEMLSQNAAEMEGTEMGAMEGTGEDIMKNMMAEFESFGEKEDYNEVLDNVMQQLLSKEMMYEPIKKVCEKYPEWLALNKARLTDADYNRYGRQYQYFQRVLGVYETEADNFPRLMELLQDLQEHGQIPAEIIKDLAPGLEFNAEGMVTMPHMGENLMPQMPGIPNPMGADPQDCSIM